MSACVCCQCFISSRTLPSLTLLTGISPHQYSRTCQRPRNPTCIPEAEQLQQERQAHKFAHHILRYAHNQKHTSPCAMHTHTNLAGVHETRLFSILQPQATDSVSKFLHGPLKTSSSTILQDTAAARALMSARPQDPWCVHVYHVLPYKGHTNTASASVV